MRILIVLLILSFSKLSFSQEITSGLGLFINSTNFKSNLSSNGEVRLATYNSRPWVGMNLGLNEKVDLQINVSWYNQVNESKSYAGYKYRYSFLTLHNNVIYRLADGLYAGAGFPLNFTTHATQSTNFGSIDLLEEGNAPGMLYGYNVLVGYRNEIRERSTLYVDLTRSHFLNSLDRDPDQKLTAKSYVFSIKMAFSL